MLQSWTARVRLSWLRHITVGGAAVHHLALSCVWAVYAPAVWISSRFGGSRIAAMSRRAEGKSGLPVLQRGHTQRVRPTNQTITTRSWLTWASPESRVTAMISLGVILIVLGLVLPALVPAFAYANVLFSIGVVLLIVGLILMFAGRAGHAIGGRRHYY